MNAAPEGRIDITLRCRAGRVAETRIRSSRRPIAQRLFADRQPAQAAILAGSLFSVCGAAQRIAVEAACEAAEGRIPAHKVVVARQRKILAELAYEHAWRLLMDWPARLGQGVDAGQMLALRRAMADPGTLADALEALLSGAVLGESATQWRARCGVPDLAGFEAWAAAATTPLAARFAGLAGQGEAALGQVPLLPPVAGLGLDKAARLANAALASEAFTVRPVWAGSAAETGAIARCADQAPVTAWLSRHGRGAGARLLARLVELTWVPDRLRQLEDAALVRAWSLPEGVGIAAVETGRGLLLHVVRLVADRIVDYRIVAPTEWNFHPAGALAEALTGLPDGPSLAGQARQTVLALDPCVDYAIHLATE